jgi:hypothetical protein
MVVGILLPRVSQHPFSRHGSFGEQEVCVGCFRLSGMTAWLAVVCACTRPELGRFDAMVWGDTIGQSIPFSPPA